MARVNAWGVQLSPTLDPRSISPAEASDQLPIAVFWIGIRLADSVIGSMNMIDLGSPRLRMPWSRLPLGQIRVPLAAPWYSTGTVTTLRFRLRGFWPSRTHLLPWWRYRYRITTEDYTGVPLPRASSASGRNIPQYVLCTKRRMYLVDRNPDLIDSQSLGKFGKCTWSGCQIFHQTTAEPGAVEHELWPKRARLLHSRPVCLAGGTRYSTEQSRLNLCWRLAAYRGRRSI
jgi:hypothetical protein